MLISHKHEFIVAMPTKCGTNSLRNMALKWVRDGGDPDVLMEHPKLRHRMDVPEGCEEYQRYIVVRNPFHRMVSSFQWLLDHKNQWRHDELNKVLVEQYDGDRQRMFRRWWLTELLGAKSELSGVQRPVTHGIAPFTWVDSLTELKSYLAGFDVWSQQGVSWPAGLVRVLRLENLSADWARLVSRQGAAELVGVGVPHHNRSRDESGVGQWFASGHAARVAHELVGEDAINHSSRW